MKKFLLAGVALTALVAGPAMAADLPVRAPVYKGPPPVVTYFSWTGCYVGGHVGGLWVKKDWNDAIRRSSVGSSAATMPTAGSVARRSAATIRSAAGCSASRATMPGPMPTAHRAPCSTSAWHDRSNVRVSRLRHRPRRLCLGSLPRLRQGRRRLGEGRIHAHGSSAHRSSASQTRSGWTVGIGGEYAFTNNLTGFIEYDYYDFGTRTQFVDRFGGRLGIADIKENKSVVKVGLNWKFGKGPVVASY